MVVLPAFNAVTRPLALTIAIDGSEEVHDRPELSVLVLPSLYLPVAVNCAVNPAATLGADELTEIDESVIAGGVTGEDGVLDELPAQATNIAVSETVTISSKCLNVMSGPVICSFLSRGGM